MDLRTASEWASVITGVIAILALLAAIVAGFIKWLLPRYFRYTDSWPVQIIIEHGRRYALQPNEPANPQWVIRAILRVKARRGISGPPVLIDQYMRVWVGDGAPQDFTALNFEPGNYDTVGWDRPRTFEAYAEVPVASIDDVGEKVTFSVRVKMGGTALRHDRWCKSKTAIAWGP